MTGHKQSSVLRQSSYNSLYVNPLNELKHDEPSNGGTLCRNPISLSNNKENATPNKENVVQSNNNKENAVPDNGSSANKKKQFLDGKSPSSVGPNNRVLRPSSLQLCIQLNEPDSIFGSKIWDPIESLNSNPANVWDYSDSEAAPASSWSTLPNRLVTLL